MKRVDGCATFLLVGGFGLAAVVSFWFSLISGLGDGPGFDVWRWNAAAFTAASLSVLLAGLPGRVPGWLRLGCLLFSAAMVVLVVTLVAHYDV